ncbi:HD-GYP domain-containing protein [Miltoncostaea marina]|uniref:HD-GYP domain-containing protein n=1 Tax=Miltoncostaea marina TaxID=2843215 RepID=UPI001C3C4D60|nr:HD domain-containing phosphohydrolase [Miltoncostaea marina]
MRIIATSRLQPGMRLARPVYSVSSGARMPLLRPDAVVTERVRAGLARAGVFAVYIDDHLSEGIAPTEPISPELRDHAVRELSSVFSSVTTDGTSTRVAGEQVERLGGLVKSVLGELRESRHMVSALMDLQAFDAYTLGHSLNVCVLGLMLGDAMMRQMGWEDGRGVRRFDHLDDRLEKLGVGLLLHDIGKLVVPAHILQKPGRLTEDEMSLVRNHPQAGLDMIERGALSALSRVVIIGHHERMDGRGYPNGRGADLHPHAQLAGMADVYDAVSSMRVYHARRPTHEAWELVLSLAGSAFPIELVEIFKRTIAPYPEGVAVRLSDGRRGIVARTSREHITRPRIRVTHDADGAAVAPHDIELYEELHVTIADTLQDLEGADDPTPPPAERTPDELHEQRMAAVV